VATSERAGQRSCDCMASLPATPSDRENQKSLASKFDTSHFCYSDRRLIIIYGAGGHAQVVADAARAQNLAVSGFCSDEGSGHRLSVPLLPGLRTVGTESFVQGPPQVVAIGENERRRRIASLLPGLFRRIVHPSCVMGSDVEIGEGAMVLHRTVVGTGARVGCHAIVNTAATVGTGSVVGDFAHVAPHSWIGSGAQIGAGVLVGAGSVIAEGVTIGPWTTIGARALIMADIPAYKTAVGDPFRVLTPLAPRTDGRTARTQRAN
jgi:acetyltransferase EpsM